MFSLILITIYIFKIIFTLKQKAIMLSKRQEFFIQTIFKKYLYMYVFMYTCSFVCDVRLKVKCKHWMSSLTVFYLIIFFPLEASSHYVVLIVLELSL